MSAKPVVRIGPLSEPQARAINHALALYEADDHDRDDGYNDRTVKSVRRIVWDAMQDAGVEP